MGIVFGILFLLGALAWEVLVALAYGMSDAQGVKLDGAHVPSLILFLLSLASIAGHYWGW